MKTRAHCAWIALMAAYVASWCIVAGERARAAMQAVGSWLVIHVPLTAGVLTPCSAFLLPWRYPDARGQEELYPAIATTPLSILSMLRTWCAMPRAPPLPPYPSFVSSIVSICVFKTRRNHAQ